MGLTSVIGSRQRQGGDENLHLIMTRDRDEHEVSVDGYGSMEPTEQDHVIIDEQHDVLEGGGIYEYWRGWNVWAGLAVLLGVLPCVPGFLVAARILPEPDADASSFSRFVVAIYHYAWFVAIFISFVGYWLLMHLKWHGHAEYIARLRAYKDKLRTDASYVSHRT